MYFSDKDNRACVAAVRFRKFALPAVARTIVLLASGKGFSVLRGLDGSGITLFRLKSDKGFIFHNILRVPACFGILCIYITAKHNKENNHKGKSLYLANMNKVSRQKAEDDLKQTIIQTVSGIGGLEAFVKSGDVVLLKPNFNTADPFPASTSLDFLKAAVELFYDYGAKLVIVGESSTMTLNTRKVMESLDVFTLQDMERPPRIIVFEDRDWVEKRVPGGKYLKSVLMPDILERVDKLVLLPCLKTHFAAQLTASLKLAVGFMKPHQRVRLHLRNIQEKIAELNLLVHPALIIMDARKCFITRGPSDGEVREPGLILASGDREAIDIEGMKIIQSFEGNSLSGLKPEELSQIKRWRELGAGRLKFPKQAP
jgi:uncharacterized protein (DUF362 family)